MEKEVTYIGIKFDRRHRYILFRIYILFRSGFMLGDTRSFTISDTRSFIISDTGSLLLVALQPS